MPRYKVLERSYIDNRIVEAGAIITFDGKPGANLQLVEDAPRKADKSDDGKPGKTDDGK